LAEKILEKGYIQIYTGNGKGKSTAAYGLAMRMAGNGGRIFIGRFMKGRWSGEFAVADAINALEAPAGSAPEIQKIQYEDFGSTKFIIGTPSAEDIALAQQGLKRCAVAVSSGAYDLVILDEIINALFFGLLTEDEVLSLLDTKAEHTEVVMTGRNASQRLIDRADLVTEMKDVKHYYDAGVPARHGIED
jgi:cob(I)alamin adenosyltransferase